MQYDLSNQLDRERLKARLTTLLKKGSVIDLTEKVFRSPRQNRYLHLLLGVVAMETGNTLEDVKREYFKGIVNKDIFVSYKVDNRGNTIATYRSTADLSEEQMSVAIDRFKRWGAENGIYLPNPEDLDLLKQIEIDMGRMNQYL